MANAREMSQRTKGLLILLALWAVVAATLAIFRHVLLPFAIAFVIAYLLEPGVEKLTRIDLRGRHLPRWVAVLLIYLVVLFFLWLFAVMAIPQLYGELARLIQTGKRFFNSLTPERIAEISNAMESWLSSRGIPVELSRPEAGEAPSYGLSLDLEQSLHEGLANLSAALKSHFFDAVGLLQHLVQGVLTFVFRFFFILMVGAFLLIDWEVLYGFFRSLLPEERRGDFDQLARSMDQKLSGVVRGQAIICLVNGSLTLVGLLLFKVPFALILSVIATVLAAIPIFGTIFSSVPIVLFALTQGLNTGLAMLAWIVGIHALEAYVLNPKIMGAHAQIHPVLVAFALLAGEATFGFVGALFAVPVTGILAAIFELAHSRAAAKLAERPQETGPAAE